MHGVEISFSLSLSHKARVRDHPLKSVGVDLERTEGGTSLQSKLVCAICCHVVMATSLDGFEMELDTFMEKKSMSIHGY